MYTPSPDLLKKYADILVKFALRSGHGAKHNEVIFVQLPECAKVMYLPLQKAILEVGAHPIFEYLPDGVAKHFFEHAQDHHLSFYPSHYFEGKIKQMTHVISIIAEHDKYELQGIDPKKMSMRIQSRLPYKQLRIQKELENKMTWTLGLFGTEAMAKEVGLSLEEYREQIIKACYLESEDPIAEWKKTFSGIESIITKLDALPIEWVHVQGEDVDLKVKIGLDRKWVGGSGRNIPSFEIFTSPDWRGTEGWIRFNQPLYIYGQMIKGISLVFKNGEVVEYNAQENKELLKEIIEIPGGNRIGEFSLTDGRFSHITKFMGETLYDENVGGQYGNTHIALGSAYEECFRGDAGSLTIEQKIELGFNQSAEHKDIVSTTNRTVTAILGDGSEKVIYRDGQFVL